MAQWAAEVSGLLERIARKDAANEALLQRVLAQDVKFDATMIDMGALQSQVAIARGHEFAMARLAADRLTECHRLSDLLIKQEQELAALRPKPAPAPEHAVHRAIRQGTAS